jgi:CheY-like chemotaxis protein
VVDITEHKRVQEALADANRRKDEFLAMLAHELRNPLAPICNSLQFLRLKGDSNADLQWAREVIDRNVSQMVRLVDDLLDVSRITRGKIRLQREPLNLAEVINQAAEISRPLIDSRRHELHIATPSAPVRIHGDATRLAQVVANLLNNAAKYTDEGGRIDVVVERSGQEIALRVRDTGIGLPPEMAEQVFEPFTQVERSTERTQGGLGIGLTLVRRLVELHEGRVAAHSEGLGRGCEVTVWLPELKEETAPSPPPAPPQRTPGRSAKRRVLVVDDNVDAANTMALLLRLAGHDVRTAHDGPSAIDAARTHPPEVILLDIGLPGMDGYEVARRLRASPTLDGCVLVALTGYGQEEDRRRSWAAGFDHHLVKPVEPQSLTELLAECTRSKRPATQAETGGVEVRAAHGTSS